MCVGIMITIRITLKSRWREYVPNHNRNHNRDLNRNPSALTQLKYRGITFSRMGSVTFGRGCEYVAQALCDGSCPSAPRLASAAYSNPVPQIHS